MARNKLKCLGIVGNNYNGRQSITAYGANWNVIKPSEKHRKSDVVDEQS